MEATETPLPLRNRKMILWSMTLFFIILALGIFLYWLLWGRFYEYTNDAYVSGNLVYVTPQISGIVTSIYIDDTQRVEEGHLLIKLDTTDAEIALDECKAALGEEIRNVAQIFLQTQQALALIEVAKADFLKYAQDFERRIPLVESGGVSKEDFEHSEIAFTSAYFTLASTEANYFSLFAQTDNTSIENHPRVQKAVENLKNAWVQLKRTTLTAPTSGLIAERSVQIGQRVKAGDPLFAIIPLEEMWVNANFKEVQIGKMQIGQTAHLKADVYGDAVKYHGYIEGIGGGTGSVFSVLPPQNATGNWIKIVQRVPVRIHLDSQELLEHPLRLGLSMDVTVDIHNIGHSSIPPITPTQPIYQTDVFAKEEEGVETVIQKIFKENLPSLPGIP